MDNTTQPRSGPLSGDEKDFILTNAESMDYRTIASRLRRNPDTIKKFILSANKKIIGLNEFESNPEYDIQRSPVWATLKEELSDEEIKIFLYHWSRIIGQFRDDVLPTEELQIIDSIKIEILLHRTLKNQRSSIKNIDDLDAEVIRLKKEPESPEISSEINNLERQLSFARTSIESLGREYNNLLEQKNKLLKELKATRAERIKNIESSRQTVIGWITELLRNKGLRKELGLQMEKMRIAVDIEKVRLMEPHKYIDGNIDYPLLNSETIEKLSKEETEENESINNGS